MTIEEKREAVKNHCITRVDCKKCKLEKRKYCYGIGCSDAEIEEIHALLFGESETERGDSVMEKQTITISLERYEELILKEALYDKITDGKEVEIYLMSRKENKGGA